MPFLRGSVLLLTFGLVYVTVFAFSSTGLTPEHALVGLLALFGAALLPCLDYCLNVWKQVRSRDQESNPALLALRRDLDLVFRTQEDHAERFHLAIVRLESELTPPPPATAAAVPDPAPAIAALEETVREHIAECTATGSSVRQSIVRLDTSVKKLSSRVEQLELRFGDPAPAEDIFQQHLNAAATPASPSEIPSSESPTSASGPASPSEISHLKSEVPVSSPLLSRALGTGATASGHVSRLISGGFKPTTDDK